MTERDEYLRRVSALADQARKTEFRVCVLGPGEGDPLGFQKREAIRDQLTAKGMDCFMPEERDATLPQETKALVRAPDREVELFWSSDCIILLSTRKATGAIGELGQLHAMAKLVPRFILRVIVAHPELPYPRPDEADLPYVLSLLRSIPIRIPYTQEQFDACSIVAEAVERAENLRTMKANEAALGPTGGLLPS